MIFTERTITVVNDSATINKPLILYRGDKNIELKITIVESQFKFRSTGASNVIETANASYAQLVINTPYDLPIFSEVTATENGTVIFVISAAMIDEVREVGIYDIQIRLLDDNKQSRASIPPVSNAIEIREPIAIEDGSAVDSNAVNVAKVNRALTTTSAPLEAFDSQGNYIKKTWGDGDPITDAALNKMEAGIDGVNKKIATNSSQIKDIANSIGSASNLEDLVEGRILIWHDEFNGNKLDMSKWTNAYGYTSSKRNLIYKDVSKNTEVSNSILNYYALHDYPSGTTEFSAPYIHTNNKFEFRYGLIEAKIKFSSENIYHSTFWTLGANYDEIYKENEQLNSRKGVIFPSCGEIDIAEADGKNVTSVVHFSNGIDDETYLSQGVVTLTSDGSDDFHIYGCEWTETEIKFYIDRVLKGTWDISNAQIDNYNPFKLPHFLILNCIPTINDSPTWDKMDTLVDWIRVYAPEGVTEKIIESGISIDSSVTLGLGETHLLTYTFTPENPSDMTLKWESYNENIVTCYGGKLIATGLGTTFVKCTTKNGYCALCKVAVQNTTYTITTSLSNASIDNTNTEITSGDSYVANIAIDSGYTIDTISIIMGGTDVTSSVYSEGVINIASVTGDIVITVTAVSSGIQLAKNYPSGYVSANIFSSASIPVTLNEDKLEITYPGGALYRHGVYTYTSATQSPGEPTQQINYTSYYPESSRESGWAKGDGYYTGITIYEQIKYIRMIFYSTETVTSIEDFKIIINGTEYNMIGF